MFFCYWNILMGDEKCKIWGLKSALRGLKGYNLGGWKDTNQGGWKVLGWNELQPFVCFLLYSQHPNIRMACPLLGARWHRLTGQTFAVICLLQWQQLRVSQMNCGQAQPYQPYRTQQPGFLKHHQCTGFHGVHCAECKLTTEVKTVKQFHEARAQRHM